MPEYHEQRLFQILTETTTPASVNVLFCFAPNAGEALDSDFDLDTELLCALGQVLSVSSHCR